MPLTPTIFAAPAPDASWTWEPGVLALCAIVTYLYVRRWLAVRAESGTRGAGTGRLALFLGGIASLLLALVSPVDRLADQLLTMHMVQHVLLLDIAPVLLILGLSKVLLRPVTRRLQHLEHAAGPLGHPAFAVAFYVLAMWVWHVPVLYDAAARHPAIHAFEHLCFMSAGLLYWWHIIGPLRSRLRASGMGPVIYMGSTKLLVGVLGVVLTFSPSALYPFYTDQPHYWGMSPSTDQAVAGMVMALEQSIVMGIAIAWLFARMLGESEREEQRAERFA
jgi:cytochrome c oxidase assembly factor CtaG